MSITIADSLANPHIVCMSEHHAQPEGPSHALIHSQLRDGTPIVDDAAQEDTHEPYAPGARANSNRQKGNGRKQVSSKQSNMRHSGANVRKPRHYPP